MRTRQWGAGLGLLLAVVGGAWPAGSANAAPAKVSVVAAEDFWGSIARQLGGEHADVTSIIADPDTDPHDYEAKPSDGAALATAQVAIVNGIGYDGWTTKLLAANPSSSRKVVTWVGRPRVGASTSGNSLAVIAFTSAGRSSGRCPARRFEKTSNARSTSWPQG